MQRLSTVSWSIVLRRKRQVFISATVLLCCTGLCNRGWTCTVCRESFTFLANSSTSPADVEDDAAAKFKLFIVLRHLPRRNRREREQNKQHFWETGVIYVQMNDISWKRTLFGKIIRYFCFHINRMSHSHFAQFKTNTYSEKVLHSHNKCGMCCSKCDGGVVTLAHSMRITIVAETRKWMLWCVNFGISYFSTWPDTIPEHVGHARFAVETSEQNRYYTQWPWRFYIRRHHPHRIFYDKRTISFSFYFYSAVRFK